jgi:hypothetical protein
MHGCTMRTYKYVCMNVCVYTPIVACINYVCGCCCCCCGDLSCRMCVGGRPDGAVLYTSRFTTRGYVSYMMSRTAAIEPRITESRRQLVGVEPIVGRPCKAAKSRSHRGLTRPIAVEQMRRRRSSRDRYTAPTEFRLCPRAIPRDTPVVDGN